MSFKCAHFSKCSFPLLLSKWSPSVTQDPALGIPSDPLRPSPPSSLVTQPELEANLSWLPHVKHFEGFPLLSGRGPNFFTYATPRAWFSSPPGWPCTGSPLLPVLGAPHLPLHPLQSPVWVLDPEALGFPARPWGHSCPSPGRGHPRGHFMLICVSLCSASSPVCLSAPSSSGTVPGFLFYFCFLT